MAAEEKMNIGRWYIQERERKQKELSRYLSQEEKTRDSAFKEAFSRAGFMQDLNLKLKTLEEKQQEIIRQRKDIEKRIK
jgi:hypothetical protein